MRQAKADIAGPAHRVTAQFFPNHAHQGEEIGAGRADCADRHRQWVDNHVFAGNAVALSPLDDLLGHGKADARIVADPRLIVADRNHRHVILGHHRQHRFEPIFFTSHAVDDRPALGHFDARNQGRDDAAVDAKRHIGNRLDQLDHLDHQIGLSFMRLDTRDAYIHIQNMRPSSDLRLCIAQDTAKIAGQHLGFQLLASRRVDAFADDHKGIIGANRD